MHLRIDAVIYTTYLNELTILHRGRLGSVPVICYVSCHFLHYIPRKELESGAIAPVAPQSLHHDIIVYAYMLYIA